MYFINSVCYHKNYQDLLAIIEDFFDEHIDENSTVKIISQPKGIYMFIKPLERLAVDNPFSSIFMGFPDKQYEDDNRFIVIGKRAEICANTVMIDKLSFLSSGYFDNHKKMTFHSKMWEGGSALYTAGIPIKRLTDLANLESILLERDFNEEHLDRIELEGEDDIISIKKWKPSLKIDKWEYSTMTPVFYKNNDQKTYICVLRDYCHERLLVDDQLHQDGQEPIK